MLDNEQVLSEIHSAFATLIRKKANIAEAKKTLDEFYKELREEISSELAVSSKDDLNLEIDESDDGTTEYRFNFNNGKFEFKFTPKIIYFSTVHRKAGTIDDGKYIADENGIFKLEGVESAEFNEKELNDFFRLTMTR